MTPEARRSVARRAAAARWIGRWFGSASFRALGFPGGELVDTRLADLAGEKVTIGSLVVSLAAGRLRREDVPVGPAHENPEARLYALIERSAGDLAHARYGAYLRQMSSFADACRRSRLDA